MRRKADEASLPPTGDQLPVDPRPNKAIPQSEKTRFILVHDLPPEGRDDGVTSVRFEVPADGIIDDLKQAISDALTSSRLYLPRRAFFLKLRDVHQPYFTQLKNIEPDAELSFQWSATEATCFYTSPFVVSQRLSRSFENKPNGYPASRLLSLIFAGGMAVTS